MRWRKLGLVYVPPADRPWAREYAHLPTPIVIKDGQIRVYFAGLDENKYGRIGYVDVAADEPTKVLAVSKEPALDLGEPGLFDDCGVNPSFVYRHEDRWRMYYIGWSRGTRVPYQLFTGLAESRDGRRFKRLCRVPVLDRTDGEPFLRSAACVRTNENFLQAWYVSARGWTTVNGERYPRYVVRMALSRNGLDWLSGVPPAIDLEGDEFGIGRPWVIQDPDRWRMWYSIRSKSRPYRMGYAESDDGEVWRRMDDRVGIAASEGGWDSEMICYAAVIDVNGRRLMFYNGNRHGQSGFGVAELESE